MAWLSRVYAAPRLAGPARLATALGLPILIALALSPAAGAPVEAAHHHPGPAALAGAAAPVRVFAPGTTVDVAIQGFAFSPDDLTIPAGTSVRWVQQDGGTEHSATSDPGAPVAFDTDLLPTGGAATVTFTVPGVYHYHCKRHSFMTAVLTVAGAGPTGTPAASATASPPSSTPPAATATASVGPATPGTATATATAGSATPTTTAAPCAIIFHDVQPADYFYTAVQYLACHGVISGYSDGTFRPYNQTTRSQLVKIVVLGFAKPVVTPAAGGHTFADILPGSPFFGVVETAAAGNIVSGYACGGPSESCDELQRPYFRPYNNVTRGQLAKIVVVAAGYALVNPPSRTFSDVLPNTAFYPFVETASCHGLISGYACGGPDEACDLQSRPYVRPARPATRGQIAKIAYLAITAGASCDTPAR